MVSCITWTYLFLWLLRTTGISQNGQVRSLLVKCNEWSETGIEINFFNTRKRERRMKGWNACTRNSINPLGNRAPYFCLFTCLERKSDYNLFNMVNLGRQTAYLIHRDCMLPGPRHDRQKNSSRFFLLCHRLKEERIMYLPVSFSVHVHITLIQFPSLELSQFD